MGMFFAFLGWGRGEGGFFLLLCHSGCLLWGGFLRADDVGGLFRTITLTKNSQFYVREGDVERLIAQGYLQKLS